MNGKTIYHVSIGDDDHHYFGSLAAVYSKYTQKELGVSLQRLYDIGITPDNPYKNDKCIIRKGVLVRKKTNRKKPAYSG